MLSSMLSMLLDNLGYAGPKKSYDEMLPQLHVQCQRRLESSESKTMQLSSHVNALQTRTVDVADEVANIQEIISEKFREMHSLLEDKEVAFKQQIATLAADMQKSISDREAECEDMITSIQGQSDQLRQAMQQKDELSFVSTVAHVPLAEPIVPTQMLQIPSANFQVRAAPLLPPHSPRGLSILWTVHLLQPPYHLILNARGNQRTKIESDAGLLSGEGHAEKRTYNSDDPEPHV